MISRINSVLIWSEDVNRLVPFYRDVLGLKAEMQGEFAVFSLDGVALVIGKHSDVHGRSSDPYRVMVNFQVADCQAEYEQLRQQGVEFIRPPSEEGDGFTIATLLDPDGNVLQLFEGG